MQIRNNYDILWKKTDGSQVGTGVFNGDIGTVTSIDAGTELVTVLYDDREVEYEFSQLGELEPAFAMTVHKSQGSEYPVVIMPLLDCPPKLMYRNLLYTGVTRAKKILVIVGDEEKVGKMTYNNKQNKRYSALKDFLLY